MSEKRLINANAFKRQAHIETVRQGLNVEKILLFCELIDMQPTIDAVEVVRCACCISFMEYTAEDTQAVEGADGDCFIRMNFSDYPDYYAVKKDDYCSYGKRKES